jgi:hypothetical protein
LQDPTSKIPNTKNWAGRVAQGESPEFKPHYREKKKKSFLRESSAFKLFKCIFGWMGLTF